MSERLAYARAAHRRGESLIGDRLCCNCGWPLFEHCERHLIPCCPGKCPTSPEGAADSSEEDTG